jgi:Tfp pilus assembly protein PilV
MKKHSDDHASAESVAQDSFFKSCGLLIFDYRLRIGDARLRRQSKIEIRNSKIDRGVTLIETSIAILVALVGVFYLGKLIFLATVTNKNQGSEATRAVIYTQDKLEKLLSRDWNSCTQPISTPQPTSCNTTGITDSGWTTGLVAPTTGAVSSTVVTTTPVALTCPTVPSAYAGYVDFLNADGVQLTGACSSVTGTQVAYIREWSITDLTSLTGGPAMKQITVAVYSALAVNAGAGKPIVVASSLLTKPY